MKFTYKLHVKIKCSTQNLKQKTAYQELVSFTGESKF